MEAIQLTDAEIKLIQAQREAKEAQLKEEQARVEAEKAKKILTLQTEIKKWQDSLVSYKKDADNMVEKLNKKSDNYVLTLVKRKKSFELYDYDIETSTRNYYFKETIEYDEYKLTHKSSEKHFLMLEHTPIWGGSYYSRSSYITGFQIEIRVKGCADWKIENKTYKNIKTAIAKLEADIEERLYKSKMEARAKDEHEQALIKAQELFPNGKSEKIEEWYHASSPSQSRYIKVIRTTFENGLDVKFRISKDKDGEIVLYKHSIDFNKIGFVESVQCLANLPKKD